MLTKERYFVTVEAKSESEFWRLGKFDLDLFGPITKAPQENRFTIEGLLTMKEKDWLGTLGYRVTVNIEASKVARASVQIGNLQDWIKAMEG
jgi:hypothetical protein